MTIKRLLFRILVRTLEYFTLILPPRRSLNVSLQRNEDKQQVDIVVIAFNNLELLEYQYKFIKKNLNDKYSYIIADNSTNKAAREQIEKFCYKNNISYFSMPFNFLNFIGGSYSHAACINYVCHKILPKRQSKYYAFIDHDLFPIAKYSIIEHLKTQPVYGVLRDREVAWYIWAGMAFFSASEFAPKTMDFMPIKVNGVYLDTGGGNWKYLKNFNLSETCFPNVELIAIRDGDDYHLDKVQYIDNSCWLHTINGSCWNHDAGGDKMHIIEILLNEYLNQC